jgi:outer membrane receptor protein involved in Fe transport
MITHNANVGYRWGAGAPRWLDGAAVRLQVNNVLDREPSLADETNGYVGGTSHVRGRQFALEISRRF